jgi:hypothetical protein
VLGFTPTLGQVRVATVELVEPRLLGKDSEEVFSLFTTFHNVHVLITFVFFKLISSLVV